MIYNTYEELIKSFIDFIIYKFSQKKKKKKKERGRKGKVSLCSTLFQTTLMNNVVLI